MVVLIYSHTLQSVRTKNNKKVLNLDFAQNLFWEKSLVQNSNYVI